MLEKEKNTDQKEIEQRAKTFNGLTAKEWARMSMSVIDDVSSVRSAIHTEHGATFPQKLAERYISMYSNKNDVIFDPFAGTGTTLFAAEALNRKAIGFELQKKFFEYIKFNLSDNESQIFEGDSILGIKKLKKESIQLTFTSPPYADLLRKVNEDREKRNGKSWIIEQNNSTSKIYSELPQDLGNMGLDEYFKKVVLLMRGIYKATKKGGYNVWVVKDFRDTKKGIPYVDLHTLIAKAGQKAGFKYHDLIIWDQSKQRRNVLLGYPSVMYVNQNHSYLVVLRKW